MNNDITNDITNAIIQHIQNHGYTLNTKDETSKRPDGATTHNFTKYIGHTTPLHTHILNTQLTIHKTHHHNSPHTTTIDLNHPNSLEQITNFIQ